MNAPRPPRPATIVSPGFFAAPPEILARRLIGCTIASMAGNVRVSGRIVEVEAYLAEDDAASHAVRAFAAARTALAAGPGALYIHPMRGRWAIDIVAEGGTVLLRAAEPLEGLDAAAARRGAADPFRLMRGPACLGEALAVARAFGGAHLADPGCPLAIEAGPPLPAVAIALSPRIGVRRSAELPLRFFAAASPYVSGRALRRTPEAR